MTPTSQPLTEVDDRESPPWPATARVTGVQGAGWWRSLRRSGQGITGGACLFIVLCFAFVAPWLSPDPTYQDLANRLAPPVWAGGSPTHVFGTDSLGRDVVARLAGGIQNSLWIVGVSMAASLLIGTAIGLAAGYSGGWLDALVMRLADIQLAFPEVLLILLVVATLGPGVGTLILVLGLTGWVLYARVVRSQVMTMKEQEFVVAARALGANTPRILLGHILPNLSARIIVVASFATANIVLIEAALSFLGLGVPPPAPSLGGMIAEGQAYLTADPWLCIIPGVAIFIIVTGVNLLADWLRDFLDPRMVV